MLNGVTDELGEFQTLLVGDGGAQILNFDQTFAYEDDLRDVRNTRNPGVTDQLGIEGQQSIRLFTYCFATSIFFSLLTISVPPGIGLCQ